MITNPANSFGTQLVTKHMNMSSRKTLLSATSVLALTLSIGAAIGAETRGAETSAITYHVAPDAAIERISVVGGRAEATAIPGAATYLGEEELTKFEYSDINRILRQVPGINLQEEDGYGLRPNIGIRGTGIERSERITLMEDGVLIAPAPYAAPAAYYFPTAARMAAVEVRKGSSAIKFGPRTTGGAINLVSTPIGDETGGFAKARVGSDGFYEGHGALTLQQGNVGVLLEGFRSASNGFKKLDGGGDTGFGLTDLMGKLRVALPGERDHYMEFKLGYTDQTSNETYLGLTDEDFSSAPFRRYAASQKDQFNSTHYQAQASHFIQLNDVFDLTTVAYYNTYERDWFKLDDLNFDDGRGRIRPGAVFADPTSALNIAALQVLRGDADSADDALQLRHNAREYYSRGIHSILGAEFDMGGASHQLEIGLRYHEDQEDRLQNRENFAMRSGAMVLTSRDAAGSNANRVAEASALALSVQDEISLGRLRLVPGIRFEWIDLARFDYGSSDPARADGPTGTRTNDVNVAIPGLGVAYEATDYVTVFAGVHRGFSPPGPSNNNAREEKSTNFETGLKYSDNEVSAEVVGFYNDYSNLLGTCSNATGCETGDIGDQFNGGAVSVSGVEARMSYTASLSDRLWMPINVAYTLTKAEFDTDFSDGFWGDVVAGDSLPYIPRHQLNLGVGVEHVDWSVNFTVNYVSESRASAGHGSIPLGDLIEDRVLVDVSAGYRVLDNVRVFMSVENIFDTTYIAARRPYGARPGKPRTVFAGVGLTF